MSNDEEAEPSGESSEEMEEEDGSEEVEDDAKGQEVGARSNISHDARTMRHAVMFLFVNECLWVPPCVFSAISFDAEGWVVYLVCRLYIIYN